MKSAAFEAFDLACVDVENLLWFHGEAGGGGQGRRGAHFLSLNKSAIVLLCAAWETYLEAVIVECADRNIAAATTPSDMLRSLQKLCQGHIREGKVENAWISVAGDGWRALTSSLVRSRVAALNTPKPGPITELFKSLLGIDDIKDNWTWQKNALGVPTEKLQSFVELRGAISHGEQLTYTVTKSKVMTAYDLVERLVVCVEAHLVIDGLLAVEAAG